MMRIFFLFFLLPIALVAQTGTQILSYTVSAAMRQNTEEITGIIAVQLINNTESLERYTFLVPKEMSINSINNAGNESLNFERDQTTYAKYAVTVRLPEVLHKEDTFTFSLHYTSAFDTSNTMFMFVNQKEFFLPFTDSVSWLPSFGANTAQQYSLEVTLPSIYSLIADSKCDTTVSDTMRIWKRSSSQPVSLSSAFTCCGIAHAIVQTSYGNDSLNTISIVSSAERFNQQYAGAITQQLNEAVHFFSALTGKPRERFNRTIAIIGSEQFNTNAFETKNFIIHHNSPAHLLFDSIALTSSTENKWLLNTAKYFCPVTNDSTALFKDGLASYLAARFLASRFTRMEFNRQERFNAIASSLTFFPYGTIAEGHTSKANVTEVFTAKGRYVFLMLEYILGQDAFDSVLVRMNDYFSTTAITFSGFRHLCETEYGSSLNWFFDQWLHRTTAPEFVLTWKNEKTVRGMTIVRVTIEQRGDIFSTPINLAFQIGNRSIQKRIIVSQQKQDFSFTFSTPPTVVELDPQYNILRWLLEIRILAHARSAQLFLSINRDVASAEREAVYTVQLDPNNSTGSIPLAYYILGKIAVVKNDLEKAQEYFLKAMPLSGTRETEQYKLWSLIRYANIVEMEGKRNEALVLLQRAIAEGQKDSLIFERAIIEAGKYLREHFISNNDIWYGAF